MSSLKLTLGTLTVTLNRFLDTKAPRSQAIGASVDYAASGNAIISGALRNPHIWTINTPLEATERRLILSIHAEQERLRIAGSDPSITLEDSIQEFHEATPRTRALATGASETTIATGFICYYAKFKGVISNQPEIVQLGKYKALSFQILETGVVAP